MSFTSYEFIFFFFALLVLYYVLPKKCQVPLLLIGSYAFYLCAGPQYALYLVAVTLITWVAARLIAENAEKQDSYLKEHKGELNREEKKAYKKGCARKRYRMIAASVIVILAILVFAKYIDILISGVNSILGAFHSGTQFSLLNLALPMGISFYTFRAIGYLMDVYWGKVQVEKSLLRIALYLSFFPLILQGPITSYAELSKTLYGEHTFDSKNVAYGLERMLWGFFKKMVVADRILTAVSALTADPSTYRGAYAFVVMMLYTVEIYADFSGGIDITIGVAQCFGITVEENFIRPYFSTSLKEYWRRWHISMANWFRTYLFYPVSISRPMQKLYKFCRDHFGQNIGKRIPVYLSSLIVWFATGVWHGAAWNFITWGLANWFVLMVSEELEPLYAKFHEKTGLGKGRGYHIFEILRTFLLVSSMKMFDCYTSVKTMISTYASMFVAKNWSILWDGSLLKIGLTTADYIIIAVGTLIMLLVSICQEKAPVRGRIAAMSYPVRFVIWVALLVAVLLFGVYGIGYDASQFIYNRF